VATDVYSSEFDHLDKDSLHRLAAGLSTCSSETLDRCVKFVLAETRGIGHGRVRAMMCRRLKHCDLGKDQRQLLVDCILRRLETGKFSEQFRDQLRLAMHLEQKQTFERARNCLTHNSKVHIGRLATWVIMHQEAGNTGE
jgi:hypothetical protein